MQKLPQGTRVKLRGKVVSVGVKNTKSGPMVALGFDDRRNRHLIWAFAYINQGGSKLDLSALQPFANQVVLIEGNTVLMPDNPSGVAVEIKSLDQIKVLQQ